VGATQANDFPRQADEYGQAVGDHASSRTGPDGAERLPGIYGSGGRRWLPEGNSASLDPRCVWGRTNDGRARRRAGSRRAGAVATSGLRTPTASR
jgi:hypothetical protein